jgi:hypothetical protein
VFLPHPQRTISPHNGAERAQSWLTCAGRIADFLPKCSNLDRGRPGTSYEIMRSRTRNFRGLVTRFARQYCAGTGDPWVFFLACAPTGGRRRSPVASSHDRDEEGE